jgi:hypothetical protein
MISLNIVGQARPTAENTQTTVAVSSFGELLLRVSWLAILVGLLIQVLLLIVAAAAFGRVPKVNTVIVDLAQRIAWSTIVCVGISVATAASKLSVPFIGLAGLLSASAAFKVARALQKGVAAALGVPAVGAAKGPSPFVLGSIKAVEYGCLAAVIAWMGKKRSQAGALAHAQVGLGLGVCFGGIVLGYTYWASATSIAPSEYLSRGINEVLFPVGCSLVLFATERLGKHLRPSVSVVPTQASVSSLTAGTNAPSSAPTTAQPQTASATSLPASSKSAKRKPPKPTYYNLVGEPVDQMEYD